MRISDWSSDVCSSDLACPHLLSAGPSVDGSAGGLADRGISLSLLERRAIWIGMQDAAAGYGPLPPGSTWIRRLYRRRSEEHTSEPPVTNAHLVCRLLLEKKNTNNNSQM